MEEEEALFSYDDIKRALDQACPHEVLMKFDLSHWSSPLDLKLQKNEEFEIEAWNALSRTVDEVDEPSRNSDPVLTKLYELRDKIDAPGSLLANVSPLAKSIPSDMTKEVIENACQTREWIIDFVQIERRRERVSFVEDVIRRAFQLPLMPCLPNDTTDETSLPTKIGEIVSRVHDLDSILSSHIHIIPQYQEYLTQSADAYTDSKDLRSVDGINEALDVLASIPLLSLVEEKLAIRKDLLLWGKEVTIMLDDSNKFSSFDLLEKYCTTFNCILGGSSTYRSELTKELTRNEVIEEEICRFIHEDMNSMYNDIGPKVTKIYSEATAWKKRA
eukprot:CAMPEP_0194157588 /NCGR_PEP_ID=MMETSP0152-20130528/72578_1 /TAXON_ID=1049557 /ORGANISM="Thalassiothrix antarctica, Strain L6-D1" /LENGTH=330 /DNA_ID=CAMNT_0038866095 /DNA_START=333 /DNA_END=1323 /DNA_ORIENTATION=-